MYTSHSQVTPSVPPQLEGTTLRLPWVHTAKERRPHREQPRPAMAATVPPDPQAQRLVHCWLWKSRVQAEAGGCLPVGCRAGSRATRVVSHDGRARMRRPCIVAHPTRQAWPRRAPRTHWRSSSERHNRRPARRWQCQGQRPDQGASGPSHGGSVRAVYERQSAAQKLA
jgi:hypothetical protein